MLYNVSLLGRSMPVSQCLVPQQNMKHHISENQPTNHENILENTQVTKIVGISSSLIQFPMFGSTTGRLDMTLSPIVALRAASKTPKHYPVRHRSRSTTNRAVLHFPHGPSTGDTLLSMIPSGILTYLLKMAKFIVDASIESSDFSLTCRRLPEGYQ